MCREDPYFCSPFFYRSLNVKFPLDDGGLSRDGRVSTEWFVLMDDWNAILDSKIDKGGQTGCDHITKEWWQASWGGFR